MSDSRSTKREKASDSEFAINTSAESDRAAPRRSAGRSRHLAIGFLIAFALMCLVGVAVLLFTGPAADLRLAQIHDQKIDELATLRFQVELAEPAPPGEKVVFELLDAPAGAVLDPDSGVFSWTPTEAQGEGWYTMRVRAVTSGDPPVASECEFGVLVKEVNRPPVFDPIPAQQVELGSTLALDVRATDPDVPSCELAYRLVGDPPDGMTLDAKTGRLTWTPGSIESDSSVSITVAAVELPKRLVGSKQTFQVHLTRPVPDNPPVEPVEPPVAETPAAPVAPPESYVPPKTVATPSKPSEPLLPVAAQPDEGDKVLLDLFKKNRLFRSSEYTTIREIFTKRFEQKYAAAVRRALPPDSPAAKLFAKHPAVKEELFMAIDPDHDDVSGALGLFARLVKEYPTRFPAYSNLAIAIAVTWDRQGRGVYDYVGHQHRTKSSLPDGRIGPIENFAYFLKPEIEKVMQGRAQYLPWEFLVHVVNHQTPEIERQWAMTNYLAKRVDIGKCYHDVPYDDEMRDSQSRVAKLNNQAYNLPNIRLFGGVCAMQADFASRVAKSLGVPAEYVGGEARGGERHAWVMWVELMSVTPSSIQFELKSYGRYRGDRYYVGELTDPKTGQRFTDRQMELRLHTVGLNPQSKRHAALVMKAYPMLREQAKMDVTKELRFLDQVIRLCPGNEDAWHAIAKMSKDGRLTQKHDKLMVKVLNNLFTTFARFPDFTWEVFDDLIACQKVPKKRGQLYEQLVALYIRAQRPDLACKAVLTQASHLIEQEEYNKAIRGLSNTIMAFPDEGRYVPALLDKLEAVCKKVPGADKQLMDFYQTFLPKVPQLRQTRPNPYCLEMYQRAIDRFKAAGRTDAAAYWSAELARLKQRVPTS